MNYIYMICIKVNDIYLNEVSHEVFISSPRLISYQCRDVLQVGEAVTLRIRL